MPIRECGYPVVQPVFQPQGFLEGLGVVVVDVFNEVTGDGSHVVAWGGDADYSVVIPLGNVVMVVRPMSAALFVT